MVEIKHSKSQEAPINFESNNFDLEEPLSKKIKGPVRYIDEKCEDIVKSQIGLNIPIKLKTWSKTGSTKNVRILSSLKLV